MKKKGGSSLKNRFIFLGIAILLAVILFSVNSEKVFKAVKYSSKVLLKIIPILVIVLVIMTLVDYFLKKDRIAGLLGKSSGLKGFSISAMAGIISHGPIFAWYPMLDNLRKGGMSIGLVTVFLYTRAVKLPLIPLLVFYFGWEFVLVWFLYLLTTSFFLGKIIDFFVKE